MVAVMEAAFTVYIIDFGQFDQEFLECDIADTVSFEFTVLLFFARTLLPEPPFALFESQFIDY